MHDPGHTIEECEVLWYYIEKHTGQWTHKEACASGSEKRENTVKFKSSSKEINHIAQQAVYTLLSKEGSKINCDPEIKLLDEEGFMYGIDLLNIGRASNVSGSDL